MGCVGDEALLHILGVRHSCDQLIQGVQQRFEFCRHSLCLVQRCQLLGFVAIQIALLLYATFVSFTDTMLVGLSVIPKAMVGGVFALFVTGTPFSVSAAIGFIALFGIAVMEGIILLSYFNQLMTRERERSAAVLEACEVRFRPVMMTCLAAAVGLLPAAFSTAIGSQVQRPLALVVVGGISMAPLLVLIVFPVLISLFSRRDRSAAMAG